MIGSGNILSPLFQGGFGLNSDGREPCVNHMCMGDTPEWEPSGGRQRSVLSHHQTDNMWFGDKANVDMFVQKCVSAPFGGLLWA